MNKVRVLLIQPSFQEHIARGTGTYTISLYKHLQTISTISVTYAPFSSLKTGFDVVHFPFFDPFFLTLPLIRFKPTIVTVHDLIPIKYPHFFPRGIRGEIKWRIQQTLLKNVHGIITDSRHSKNDIRKLLGIPDKKIQVIPLGVEKEFLPKSTKEIQPVLTKYALPKKYILCVSDLNYNKNIPFLLAAFMHIRKLQPNLHLVLVGRGFVEQSQALSLFLREAENYAVLPYLIRLQKLSTEELVGIYNGALLYVHPSLDEGFGLPILEAMACGVPVVALKVGSIPELVGDAACLTQLHTSETFAQHILTTLADKSLQTRLRKKGLARSKQFTWQTCAEQTVSFYQRISQAL